MWPHELVYTAEGQPAIYDSIAVPLFVSSHMQAMEAGKPAVRPLMAAHVVELMGDDKLYGWEYVCAFHAVWLQQLEHGRITWADKDAKLKFQRVLVWHQPAATRKAVAAPAPAQK